MPKHYSLPIPIFNKNLINSVDSLNKNLNVTSVYLFISILCFLKISLVCFFLLSLFLKTSKKFYTHTEEVTKGIHRNRHSANFINTFINTCKRSHSSKVAWKNFFTVIFQEFCWNFEQCPFINQNTVGILFSKTPSSPYFYGKVSL